MFEKKRGKRLVATFQDDTGTMDLVWFRGQKWIRESLKLNSPYVIFGKTNVYKGRFNMPHPELELLVDHKKNLRCLHSWLCLDFRVFDPQSSVWDHRVKRASRLIKKSWCSVWHKVFVCCCWHDCLFLVLFILLETGIKRLSEQHKNSFKWACR